MKKIKLFLTAMLATMALASGAHAYPAQLSAWNLDLTRFELGSYDNVKSIQIAGTGTVRQYLGDDNVLSVGDRFTEYSDLFLMSFINSNGIPGGSISTSSKVAVLTADNMQGFVSYIDSNGGFQYTFTPGTGDLRLQVADVINEKLENFVTVSSFTLLSPSTGVAKPEFFNNPDANGTSDLFAAISGASDVWTTTSGYDFGNTGTALLHTTNTVDKLYDFELDQTTGQYFFDADISSAGNMTAAVPEPGTMVLLGAGLFGLAIFSRRKINK